MFPSVGPFRIPPPSSTHHSTVHITTHRFLRRRGERRAEQPVTSTVRSMDVSGIPASINGLKIAAEAAGPGIESVTEASPSPVAPRRRNTTRAHARLIHAEEWEPE